MENKRTRKPPAYLKDFTLPSFDMQNEFASVYEVGDLTSEHVVQHETFAPKSDKASVSVHPKILTSTNTVNELDKTIEELTIQNKILERDLLLAEQNAHLVAKKTFGVDKKTSCDKSDNDRNNCQAKIKGKDFPYLLFKDKQKRKAVSGEARAAKDRVKYDVPWPHEHAQTKSLSYSDEDFGFVQLVRGELFIMHNIEEQAISMLRQKHLINLLYLAEKYPFTEIKDFHAEVLRSVERGHKHWSHTFSEEQGRTLVSALKMDLRGRTER
ncbi:unnamed protein product [Mytilus edulis]|uniref:Uncharacterized protein n=2 Tax=Mytilus TaxID=6548 RepID=A0A8B6FIX3_MYTGA|nr:unnamed protein product [Mytilus edulis]VDI50947.1 Hypothetical predicted protein [Mytilus galloprovincialis]